MLVMSKQPLVLYVIICVTLVYLYRGTHLDFV